MQCNPREKHHLHNWYSKIDWYNVIVLVFMKFLQICIICEVPEVKLLIQDFSFRAYNYSITQELQFRPVIRKY